MAVFERDDVTLQEYETSVILKAGQDNTDDKLDRLVFYIKECPLADRCSENSWRRCRPWSYDDPSGAIAIVRSHLCNSSLHGLSEEDADTLCNEIEPETYNDLWTDRHDAQKNYQWRLAEDLTSAQQAAAAPGPEARDKGGGRKGKVHGYFWQDHERLHLGQSRVLRKGGSSGSHRHRSGGKGSSGSHRSRSRSGGGSSRGKAQAIGSRRPIASSGAAHEQPISAPNAQAMVRARQGSAPNAQEHILVPLAQAQLINDSLIRAMAGSKNMRQALEASITVLRAEENLLQVAQQHLTTMLCTPR